MKIADPAPNVRSVTVMLCVPAIALAPTTNWNVTLAVVSRGNFEYVTTAGLVVTPVPIPVIESVPVPMPRIGRPDRVAVTDTVCVG